MKVNQVNNGLLVQNIDNLAVDYEQKSIKKLHKHIQTEEQFAEFELFHTMLKREYSPCLITKLYIEYKNNITAIVGMYNNLRTIGVITPRVGQNFSIINDLAETLVTEESFKDFTELWDNNNDKHDIKWILNLYKDKNTPTRCI